MSITIEDWDALTQLAERTGTTRTDLIRDFIRYGVSSAEGHDALLIHELDRTRAQLRALRSEIRKIAELDGERPGQTAA